MDEDPIYHGLLREPKFVGLPVVLGMAWLMSGVLLFIWSKSLWVFLYLGVSYPALYAAALWDPNFLEVWTTTLQATRPTRNKNLWGGHSYEP